tara:strand:- start:914 stop:1279 length:366 start_codon:yes stop_codon:yes gene_type:complete
MAWGLKTFGSTAWGFGDVSTAVTSTNAIASHAVGNETIVGGTGVTFGVTSTNAIASHAVGSVSIVGGTGVTFGVNSVGAFATGFVGEEVVWFEIPTNTSGAASYGIINTSGATGSWQNIIG